VADRERFSGARVLIVGGRLSAFETAALLAEAGAERVDIVHRHAPPCFTMADWSFIEPLTQAIVSSPGWYRRLPEASRQAIERRFCAEGRLKLEPWLAPRLARAGIRRWPLRHRVRGHAGLRAVRRLRAGKHGGRHDHRRRPRVRVEHARADRQLAA
jgi:cation diffusion facilitator CzcD-associated flavoprotein CzcO